MEFVDALSLAESIRNGEKSPLEAVDEAIERIERLNPKVNAVIHERFEKARAEAANDDVLPDGPLRGVPILVKDLEAFQKGEPHHGGSQFLKNAGYVADHDAYLITRLRMAGAIILGRTNTPEFGSIITTEPDAYGPTRNPYDLNRSTGGSSGGSAAAVSCGMVPVAHASDGGGSIRIPASECGLVGLKPTRGLVPLGPDVSDSWAGSTVHGVVSRTVRDSAAFLDVMSGPMPGDFYPVAKPTEPLLSNIGKDPQQLRIGYLDTPPMPDIEASADARAGVEHTLNLLQQLGHHVEDARPEALFEEKFVDTFVVVVAAHMARDVTYWEGQLNRAHQAGEIEAGNEFFVGLGNGVSAPSYLDAVYWQQEWTRRMLWWWRSEFNPNGFDILVTPVINGIPPELGWLTDEEKGLGRVTALMQYTAQFNVTGQPALSLPLWWTQSGLPVGVQFVAATGRDDLLLRLASELEGAQNWHDQLPPLFG
ncbi:MAG: 6-aminohexanoate-cyclic-dimer hydrolase [Actinomycetota bacterium]